MSLRQALPFVAVALMLALGWLRVGPPGGAGAEEPKPFVPFGERVSARAPVLPQYAADANARIRQQIASVNAMWERAFAAAGETYERPVLAAAKEGCGAQPGWAGIYCGEGTIVIDVQGHVTRHANAGQALADVVLGYIVAHEVGHHVQALRAAPDGVLRRELHADCLAGVWGKAAGLPLPPMWAYGEDADHGTAAQRARWLNAGYRSARPSDCDTIWSTSASP
ncbi:MAG TPA: neutral zinc metallopeptidase [Solirubrobacteraceae bacterium]|nr:neutral zinc metallopeptidase [Solirubrobacteraceae bacterium]